MRLRGLQLTLEENARLHEYQRTKDLWVVRPEPGPAERLRGWRLWWRRLEDRAELWRARFTRRPW